MNSFLKKSASNVVVGILLLWFISSAGNSQNITTGTLIEEMASLEHLTEHPEPFYRTIQFSSYDRRSDQPDGPGWLENSDGFGGEPTPNFEGVIEEPGEDGIGTYLLCDLDGPGAIVRGWTARINGSLKVYLDKSETPIYEGPAESFFRNSYDSFLEATDLDADIFEEAFSQRDAGYFPIPFSDHLRVEWTGDLDKLHFYELQVRKYNEEANVQTFQPEDLQAYRDEIKHTAEVLNNPDDNYASSLQGTEEAISAELAAGDEEEVFTLEDEAVIRRLALKLNAEDMDRALRQTILTIHFDGAPRGQIQAPVGDFFGAAPGINPYVSLPFTVNSDGTMISRFLMPFENSVRIKIRNMGDQQTNIEGSITHSEYDWNPERSMHLRARWRVDHNMNEQTPYDLPFVISRGAGVYVGTSSLLFNPIEIPTAGGNWWGEGDEKIFVDDEEFPSTFGTGSEDYYNYSWSSSDIFQTPYSGQPRNDGPATRGFVTNHRWHVIDPLPFNSDLHFYMEFFPHNGIKGFSYARMSYFYSRPGLIDDHVPISYDDIRHLEHNLWSPKAQGAASNSVFYQIEDLIDKNEDDYHLKEENLWAEGELFVWNPKDQGETIEIPIEIDEEGTYAIWLTAAHIQNSGEISIRINDREAGFGGSDDLVDLNNDDRKLLRNYRSEDLTLEPGNHMINLRYEGNSNREQADVGLDFVWVQKQ